MKRALSALLLVAASLTACSADEPFRILAGSEVADLEPLLKESGVEVEFTYAGTLDGAEQVARGDAAGYDATWFSSNRYLSLIDGAREKLSTQTKIMNSPVVLGLTPAKAAELGWTGKPVTWSDIATAAAAQRFTFGMTNPASSNSGFSALVGVAAALSDAGEALDAGTIAAVTPRLKEFFSAQRLTAGSSGWLADAYSARPDVDGLVNYESVLLGMRDRLTLVYPSDGVVSADYPLTLLASSGRKEQYDRLVAWLRTPETQRRIMTATHRRPIVPGVALAPEFGSASLVELPFPNRRSAADQLIAAYLNEVRVPARATFVLDTSGSMEGDRIDSLRTALVTLTGADTSAYGTFSRFRNREQVTLLPFSDHTKGRQDYQVPASNPEPVLGQIKDYAEALAADGGTAIYDALRAAYEQPVDPGHYSSIVLMTDGENTDGSEYLDFQLYYQALPPEQKAVRTFVVLFGDSDADEMNQVAKLTGGAVFDARNGSLAEAFKEIRGYQ
ncbi:solute-binding protein [Herbidospora sp. NEAU-GS84]|uniref:Solute-binding protein n=1 Tax=Herbidospora solisilvae TaxID=2696284 RepID=A0A7C9JAC0_9ACTN|nr:substrate-binding domain-containing protein [Herbidospora solisilvae]NAS20841.1 solute-binding protein [Herbidospora solisilvae]